jgi:hypothetical protein
MRTIGKAILAAVVVLAVSLGGCGSDSCPSESPRVDAVANCSAAANSTVSYPLQLCPTCNQSLTGCTVDMSGADTSGGTIFLNPVVEACDSSAACGAPSCLSNPTCTVKVPNALDGTTYTVEVHDPASGPRTGTLTVATGAPSCAI